MSVRYGTCFLSKPCSCGSGCSSSTMQILVSWWPPGPSQTLQKCFLEYSARISTSRVDVETYLFSLILFCSLGPMTCYLVSAHRFNSISLNQSPPKFQVKICTMVICCSCRNFNHEHHNPIMGERFQILHSLMNFYFISARHSKFSSRKVSVKSLVYF